MKSTLFKIATPPQYSQSLLLYFDLPFLPKI